MVFAGGQHTTGRQPWSQDIRTSEKDQFFPLYIALRPLSLAASRLDANGLCALWALPFPSLSYSPVPCSPSETLVFHLGLTSFLQQCVRTFSLPHVGSCSMQHRSSGHYLVHHSYAMVRVHVLSNSKDPIIPFLALLLPIESDHWLFDLLHPSDESTYLLFMQQPAFELSKLPFPFVAVKKTDTLWPLLCFLQGITFVSKAVYSWVNMGK